MTNPTTKASASTSTAATKKATKKATPAPVAPAAPKAPSQQSQLLVAAIAYRAFIKGKAPSIRWASDEQIMQYLQTRAAHQGRLSMFDGGINFNFHGVDYTGENWVIFLNTKANNERRKDILAAFDAKYVD